MTFIKRIICFVLVLLLFCVCVFWVSSGRTKTADAEDFLLDEPEEKPQAGREQQKSGDLVILYTSDVHCGVDQGFGYAGLARIRDNLIAHGDEVILADGGDSIKGEMIGILTGGEAPVQLMNDMGYSLAVPGNHEFEYGMEQFLSLAKEAEFEYISCNFNYKGELVFKPYVIRELAGRQIAFVGVTTPHSLSSPQFFQDDSGELVYGFLQDDTGEGVYDAVQSAVDAARAEGAEYVIVVGHVGRGKKCVPWSSEEIISHTSGIDVFLDGHSHDRRQTVTKNTLGEGVPRLACGSKLACIGWCRISAEGECTTGLYTWNRTASLPSLMRRENEMGRRVSEVMDSMNERLQEVVGVCKTDLTVNDPEEVDDNEKPVRAVRRAETNLGDFCADAYRDQTGADIAFCAGGTLHAAIPAGDITMEEILRVLPTNRALCMIEATGQQILDALEWGARTVPGEVSAFLQVSGLEYEIRTDIKSPCVTDKNSMFAGVKGKRRVKNVTVGGKPIDPDAVYTLAGQDKTLLDQGGGFTMFDGNTVRTTNVMADYQALINYAAETLNGTVGEQYGDPRGQGRIVITEEAPQ